MTPLGLFVAAVSEAGYPPLEIVEYAEDHRAAFWTLRTAMPGWVARKACEILGLEPVMCPTDDGFHLGWTGIGADDVAIVAYEIGLPGEAAGGEAGGSA